MTKKNNVYVCEICGNTIEVLRAGGGTLVCCGQAATLKTENSVDASAEKHVPVARRTGDRLSVVVGEIEHPSTPEHFIEWIELIQGDRIQRVDLAPGDRPIAEFCVEDGPAIIRAFCNLHGLWKSENPTSDR